MDDLASSATNADSLRFGSSRYDAPLIRPRPRFVTDDDCFVLAANLDACLMLDLSERLLKGRQLGMLVPREDRGRLRSVLSSITTRRAGSTTLRIRSRTGCLQDVRLEGRCEEATGNIVWMAWPMAVE